MKKFIFRLCSVFCVLSQPVAAEEALIAVATNFYNTASIIESRFEKLSEHEITLVSGSTGKLYAQIRHGAPYDVFLAADQERPRLLEGSEFGVASSRFTFAVGHLALASANSARILSDVKSSLDARPEGPFAIANPALAPYGMASRAALRSLERWDALAEDVVLGENVGQTFAMIATGNVELGMVAMSQVKNSAHAHSLFFVSLPGDLHDPIRQDAVLLSHGQENVAAIEFLRFLQTEPTREVLVQNGYGVE